MRILQQRKKQLTRGWLAGVIIFLAYGFKHPPVRFVSASPVPTTRSRPAFTRSESTKQVLLTQIAYATSDDAVRRFANDDRHWYLENDVPVFPVQDPKATPPSFVQPIPTAMAVDHWQKWWALFFGE